MNILILLIILFLLFGGGAHFGGWAGPRYSPFVGYGFGGIGFVLLIVLLVMLFQIR